MSLLVQAPSAPARPEPMRRVGQRRLLRPGVSLMAQGEPMIWLTGGAIIVCLTMILGLLVLVLMNGLPTFWPAALIRLERTDGPTLLGELASTETFKPDSKNAIQPPGSNAKEQQQTQPPKMRRRLLRTGNFELTNEHFRWVSDSTIKLNGESYPVWAVAVERYEWGRFYGEPWQFTRQLPRTPTADEQDLVSISQFLEANRWRVAAEQAAQFEKALTPLDAKLRAARAASVAHFMQQFPSDAQPQFEVQLEDGNTLSIQESQPTQDVTAIREIWNGPESAWKQFERFHDEVRQRSRRQQYLEQHELGHLNAHMEESRLTVREQEISHGVSAIDLATELKTVESAIRAIAKTVDDTQSTIAKLESRFAEQTELRAFADQFAKAQQAEVAEQLREPEATRQRLQTELQSLPEPVQQVVARFVKMQLDAEAQAAAMQKGIAMLNDENARFELVMLTADGQQKPLKLSEIVRAYPANQLTWSDKFRVYLSRWIEFLTDEPREANSEGGVFPAIWGTVVMTLIMSLLVAPFGVLAALYLREYAQAGVVVSAIRISISNLAGVPSIVFGVFGLGFFCYVLGSFVDGGPRNAGLTPLPPRAWWLLLVGLTVCGTAAFGFGLASISKRRQESRFRQWLGYGAMVLWLATLVLVVILLFGSPYFQGFFGTRLPNPTFGKGGLIWASLTLALLTLPVVIVATEEAISAVPNSLREGSYACGGSKWQTVRRIVLPHAMPGIMTGMILAMARGAGETAPLMLVGAVKLAPELPVDSVFPYVHLDRSFMHLGFHIFDVGFQSQNSDAARPMVFTTTLLLILIIATLNLTAVWIRSRLRKRYLGSQF